MRGQTSPEDVRLRVQRLIEARPGIGPSQVLEKLPMGWSTLYSHLKALEKDGCIVAQREGRLVFLYPVTQTGGERAQLPSDARLLQTPRARALAKEVISRPGEHDVATLATALQLSPRVVYHHVRRLVAGGLLDSVKPRRYAALAPTDRLTAALQQWSQNP